jgi:hypothetical protein
LTDRGLIDAVPFLCELMLTGRNLSVSVSAHIRDGSAELQRRVVDAALRGNAVALGEAARADLPDRYPELRGPCEERIDVALQRTVDHPEREIAVSFFELGDLGRHCSPARRRALALLLVAVAVQHPYDGVSKTSALVALAVLAPALEKAAAAGGLRALLPLAAGDRAPRGRPYLQSHRNLKRARGLLLRDVSDIRLRSAALQACGRLARRASPRSRALADVVDAVLATAAEEELIVMALNELAGLPHLPVRADPLVLMNDERESVRQAAATARAARADGRSQPAPSPTHRSQQTN